jgi:Mor family transcriptional regulator
MSSGIREKRNEEIIQRYKDGADIDTLSKEFWLAPSSIRVLVVGVASGLKERRDEEVQRRFRDGENVRVIAADCGLTPSSVYHICRGIPREKWIMRGAPSKKGRDEKVLAAYESGVSGVSLAEQFGVTRERIYQILRRTNAIEHRAKRRALADELISEHLDAEKDRAKQSIQAALDMVASGKSINDAARSAGVAAMTVAKYCRLNNIQSRHGRWDRGRFGERKRKISELIDKGLPFYEIIQHLRSQGDTVHYSWIVRNCPDLMAQRRGVMKKQGAARRKAKSVHGPADPGKIQKKQNMSVEHSEGEWSEPRVDLLRRKWAEGLSAQHIADLLGPPFTRNSVIGKSHRLRAEGKLLLAAGLNGSTGRQHAEGKLA